jgi:hypothetical protein
VKLLNVERWTRVRAKGLRRFVLVQGILGVGLPSALFMLAVLWIFARLHLFGAGIPGPVRWDRLLVLLLAEAVVGGLIWGLGTWYLSEWLYRWIDQTSPGHAGAFYDAPAVKPSDRS